MFTAGYGARWFLLNVAPGSGGIGQYHHARRLAGHPPAVTDNTAVRAVHWSLKIRDRTTSALATLYGPPAYGIERSALWERCLLFGMVALLMAFGMLASR